MSGNIPPALADMNIDEIREQLLKAQLEIGSDRKRIAQLERDISKLKDSIKMATATTTQGSWGIAQKRGDIIYTRLISECNGSKSAFLNTGDIKKILGVTSYSQAKAAIRECLSKHPDTRIIQRGNKKVGIEFLKEIPNGG